MPTVAASASAAKPASSRATISAIMTAISATLNSSGEKAVTKKRALRARQRQQHGGGPGESEIGQHQARIGDGELQACRVRQIPAPAR